MKKSTYKSKLKEIINNEYNYQNHIKYASLSLFENKESIELISINKNNNANIDYQINKNEKLNNIVVKRYEDKEKQMIVYLYKNNDTNELIVYKDINDINDSVKINNKGILNKELIIKHDYNKIREKQVFNRKEYGKNNIKNKIKSFLEISKNKGFYIKNTEISSNIENIIEYNGILNNLGMLSKGIIEDFENLIIIVNKKEEEKKVKHYGNIIKIISETEYNNENVFKIINNKYEIRYEYEKEDTYKIIERNRDNNKEYVAIEVNNNNIKYINNEIYQVIKQDLQLNLISYLNKGNEVKFPEDIFGYEYQKKLYGYNEEPYIVNEIMFLVDVFLTRKYKYNHKVKGFYLEDSEYIENIKTMMDIDVSGGISGYKLNHFDELDDKWTEGLKKLINYLKESKQFKLMGDDQTKSKENKKNAINYLENRYDNIINKQINKRKVI